MHEHLSKLTRNIHHLTWYFVLFSSSTIWDLFGVSDNTESKYRRDSSSPANILKTPWVVITSALGRTPWLRGQDGDEQLRLPRQLQQKGKRQAPTSASLFISAPPATLSSHSQLSLCKSWHASDICNRSVSQRELLLLLWAQWRRADWRSFRIRG